MAGITKATNEYQRMIPLYDKIPKSVFGAIAFSMCFIDMQEDKIGALTRLFEEWEALHANGIVSQKPPTKFRVAAALAKVGKEQV